MNNSKIESLLSQIRSANGVVVFDGFVSCNKAQTYEPSGERNSVVLFAWNDYSEQIKFTEENLDKAKFVGRQIVLQNSKGGNSTISLFEVRPKDIRKTW